MLFLGMSSPRNTSNLVSHLHGGCTRYTASHDRPWTFSPVGFGSCYIVAETKDEMHGTRWRLLTGLCVAFLNDKAFCHGHYAHYASPYETNTP